MRNFVICGYLASIFMLGSGSASASILYGVTGNGGNSPETLFTLSQTDASSAFVMSLGAGSDGEAIGYNPADGLIYHASGHTGLCTGGSGVCFESINSTFTGTTNIGLAGNALENEETQALTWDSARGEFLWKQDHGTGPLFSVTVSGTPTLIGSMDHQAKGLAFVGSTLYSVDRGSDLLRTIDDADASTLTSLAITLAGEIVTGATGLATNPDDGTLWALLNLDSQSMRELVTIDVNTGVATSIGTTDQGGFASLAFIPTVPEPSVIALFGAGFFGLSLARRKMRR